MENGHDQKLAEKLSGMVLKDVTSSSPNNVDNNNNNDSLFQVLKAVEAAEATIRQQAEENNRLRIELQKKLQEIENRKVDGSRPPVVENQGIPNTFGDAPSMLLQPKYTTDNTVLRALAGTTASNGTINSLHTNQQPSDNASRSPLFSPYATSLSTPRFEMEGEHDPRFNSPENGIMPIAETNTNSSLWKQDLLHKVKEHEEEILQLRKQLAEYSVKEAQIRNEKYVLEKRIAYMRLAFDQQQQDLVDAASKALSYRQDIIEENIRLTYALQGAQQERTTFVSSLLPLLAEYSLQPAVPDSQSIVSNVKVLFKHLQEQLIFAESKLKESKYQLTPWRADVNNSNYTQSSQPHSIGVALTTSSKNGLELVPQPMYPLGKAAANSRDGQIGPDWDILDHNRGNFGTGGVKNSEADYFERYSPPVNRHSPAHDIPAQLASTRNDMHTTQHGEESANKQVTFREPASNHEMDDSDIEGHQSEREPSSNWSAGVSPYTNTPDDPGSSYSPYLQPVMEEPSSSFSEADDDPLPAIEGLQISGEAYPGRELQACGYSINGTTSCNFEWVRHLEDGSVNYIEGAKQPTYLVNADDVDTYLAIEVQPLDNRKRKGELVKVFANDNKKITCDHEMQSHIEKALYGGHASYKVQLSTGYLDIWEPATLSVKRDGYSIKCSGSSGVVVTEKYSPSISINVPYGHATEFSIIGPNGVGHILRSDGSSEDGSCSREAIVLTLRLFIMRAGERKKGKKKGLFFK